MWPNIYTFKRPKTFKHSKGQETKYLDVAFYTNSQCNVISVFPLLAWRGMKWKFNLYFLNGCHWCYCGGFTYTVCFCVFFGNVFKKCIQNIITWSYREYDSLLSGYNDHLFYSHVHHNITIYSHAHKFNNSIIFNLLVLGFYHILSESERALLPSMLVT